MRRVIYVSGTRADFGLIRSTLERARASGKLDISVCVTGVHLLPSYGCTVREIEESGLRVCGRIPVDLGGESGAEMARALGHELLGMIEVLERERPDALVVLGDRAEMLAGAIAALHLLVPVVHIHGGERSGTVDEPIRHAISKLAQYHFTATEQSRERLIRMGESPDNVFVTGAPGLDGLTELVPRAREELCGDFGLSPDRPIALVVFHPVVQEADQADRQIHELLAALRQTNVQAVCLRPNADAGGRRMREELEGCDLPDIRVTTHMDRKSYVSWLAAANVMVGNSSSGIIEAATFGLPVVNVGSRQQSRERNGNVIDVPAEREAIAAAIGRAMAGGRYPRGNVYGNGHTGERIAQLLQTVPLGPEVLKKTNAY